MAFPQGINFRNTAGFVSDGANEDPEIDSGGVNYPRTTAQGNNVGWETVTGGLQPRDRNAGNDRRLAGTVFDATVGVVDTYRLDLPSTGTYKINLAAGDPTYSVQTKIELFDTTTSLGVLCSGSTGAGNSFKDATNTIYTAANWPGSNSSSSKTFASTICRFKNGDGTNTTQLAHVNVAAVVVAVTAQGYSFGAIF